MIKRFCLFLLCLLLVANPAFATSFFAHFTKSQHQLLAIKHQIHSLQSSLLKSKQQKNKIQHQLQHNETTIGSLEKKHSRTQRLLHTQRKALLITRRQYRTLKHKRQQQEQLLQQHLLAAYRLGRQPEIKLILNQQDPALIGRYMNYYHYLVQKRTNLIKQIKKTVENLKKNHQKMQSQTGQLEKINRQQNTQHQQLLQAKKRRENILRTINHQIVSTTTHLTRLKNDKKRLGNIVHLLSERSYYVSNGKYFSQTRHHLPWPIRHARLIQKYHAPIAGGRLHSSGILLKAPEGTPIHAIYAGKVVFAHWLRGYGLLVIIQHGKYYMSLYARAQSLYVKRNDTVKPGQTIATVGNTGGYQTPALYFEIRHNSQAVNPLIWLK
jgi:murein hydrolase activator